MQWTQESGGLSGQPGSPRLVLAAETYQPAPAVALKSGVA